MAPTLTVKSVRDAESGRVEALVTTLEADLAAADIDLTDARTDLAAATDALAAAGDEEADLRARIAAALMPAEAHQLELELEANLLGQGPLRAALADAEDLVATLAAARQRVAAALDVARGQRERASAAQEVADQQDAEATTWRSELAGPVLAAMVAEAGGADVTTQVTDANARLATLLGEGALVDLLAARLADAASEERDLHDAVSRAKVGLGTLQEARSAVDGAVLLTGDRFADVRDDVRAVVELGPQRLAAARSVLQSVADAPALTTAEQDRIDARAAAAVAGTPSPASDEQDLAEARVALRAAEAAFEAKALVEEAKDPAFDRDTDAAVAAERAAAAAAQTAVDDAEQAFSTADKAAIDAWEVAVPPATMALAVDGLRAIATVDELKALDLGDPGLTRDLDDAEGSYATALEAQLAADVRHAEFAALVAERLDAESAAAPVAILRLAASVRGDQ